MKGIKFKSLTMRIWMTFTIIILIIICSISLLYIFTYRSIEENAKIQDLKVAHDILLKNNDFNHPEIRFNEMRNLRGSNFFICELENNKSPVIIDISGRTGPPQMPFPYDGSELDVRKWMAGFIRGGNIYETQYIESYNNIKYIFIISSINYDDARNAYLISYMPDIRDNYILYLVIGIGITFIIIGFFTAKVVANRISKPLKELEKYTLRIARKDWNVPIRVKSRDEIGKLAESMNIMQKELRHADEEQKMFLQSISHDLKTPVMVIMSHAEAIIEGVYIESIEKTAEIIRDEAESLEKKIKQLLYLNTLDYIMEKDESNTEINLRNLLLHIISRFQTLNSDIKWQLELDEVIIKGNADKIKVSIENILDNGLRYVEKEIIITLKKDNFFAVLEIYNDGPNIGYEHIDHIFDNFYKDKTGNFGLGLAISKKIIDYYNGEINAINREKGVSFIIRYPF